MTGNLVHQEMYEYVLQHISVMASIVSHVAVDNHGRVIVIVDVPKICCMPVHPHHTLHARVACKLVHLGVHKD